MPEKQQVNIRVDRDAFEVLEAAVFVRRLRGMQELLSPVVERYAADLRGDQVVQRALDLREETEET